MAVDNKIARQQLASNAQFGKIMLLCESLKCGVSALPSGGKNPLYEASKNGHAEVVKLLLAFNVPVDETARSELTPLFISSFNGHTEVVKLLLTYNASVDMFNNGMSINFIIILANWYITRQKSKEKTLY